MFPFVGCAALSCKPEYAGSVLECGNPTIILVGPTNTGKTVTATPAVSPFGRNKSTSSPFTYKSLTEHEFGVLCQSIVFPVVVNDPPKAEATKYAEIIGHVHDHTTSKSKVLTYTPNGGPILCMNEDFFGKLKVC